MRGFRSEKYRVRSAKVTAAFDRLSAFKEGGIQDKIMVAILKQQGYSWDGNNSSQHDPDKLYEKMAAFSPERRVKVEMDTPSMRRAVDAAYSILAKPKGQPRLKVLESVEDVVDALELEKSAGLPFLGKKGEWFGYHWNRELQVRKEKKKPEPCIIMARNQFNWKTRAVYAYPMHMTIMESRFAKPFIARLSKMNTPIAMAQSKWVLGSRVTYIDDSYGLSRTMDFSGYDGSIPQELIRVAFAIIATWFSDEDLEEFGWDKIVNYFIYTPFVMPNGKVYFGKEHGVPSGSYFTQVVDSIVNVIVQFWLSYELGYTQNRENFVCLGDDVFTSVPAEITDAMLAEKVAELGLVMHPDKTDNIPHFLGALWYKGIPFRDKHELLQKMVYPERYRLYPSKDRFERHELALQLIAQYAVVNVSAWDILLEVAGKCHDMTRLDNLYTFTDAYAHSRWRKEILSGAFKHLGESEVPLLDALKRPLGAIILS